MDALNTYEDKEKDKVQEQSIQKDTINNNPIDQISGQIIDEIAEKKPNQIPENLNQSIIETVNSLNIREDLTDTNKIDTPTCSRFSSFSDDKVSINDFKCLKEISFGGFSKVFLSRSNLDNKYYAMKIVKKYKNYKKRQFNMSKIDHATTEKEILSDLEHNFIIQRKAAFQDNFYLYISFEFVECGDLSDLLDEKIRLSNNLSKFYASEIVLALQYLHNRGIIHRDLKPKNVLIDKEGHIRICDFGFAKKTDGFTRTLCGTLEHMAPETIECNNYDKSVDWWSLGILIYSLLSGRLPFFSLNRMEILDKILEGKVQYPDYFHPDAIDILSKLITADLSKRLGSSTSKSGNIRDHPWFKEISWEKTLMKEVKPPYIPKSTFFGGGNVSFDKF